MDVPHPLLSCGNSNLLTDQVFGARDGDASEHEQRQQNSCNGGRGLPSALRELEDVAASCDAAAGISSLDRALKTGVDAEIYCLLLCKCWLVRLHLVCQLCSVLCARVGCRICF